VKGKMANVHDMS